MTDNIPVVKIGVMGAAAIARRSVIPAIAGHPGFKLQAIASRSLHKASELAAQFNCKAVVGYQALLEEDIDAVYMPLPTGLQHQWAAAALQSGKHLLAEKSLGLSAAAVQEITGFALANGRVLMEDFMFQYHQQQKWVKEQLNSGIIGDIREFKAVFGFPSLALGNFRYDKQLGGGALLDAGAYTVKAAQLFFGGDLQVLGSLLQYDNTLGDADISGSALLSSASGLPLQLSWGFRHFYQCGYQVWGSKGKLSTFRSFTAGPGVSPTAAVEINNQNSHFTLQQDNHFHNILSAFSRRIAGAEVELSVAELRQQANLLEAIRNKAQHYHG